VGRVQRQPGIWHDLLSTPQYIIQLIGCAIVHATNHSRVLKVHRAALLFTEPV
jgi:hypothetical protein